MSVLSNKTLPAFFLPAFRIWKFSGQPAQISYVRSVEQNAFSVLFAGIPHPENLADSRHKFLMSVLSNKTLPAFFLPAFRIWKI